MDSPVSGNARYSKARALITRDALRQESDMIQRHNREFCGRAERPVGLRPVTPDRPPDPVRRHAFAHLIDSPRPVAMGNDAWIRHADAERVLTFLDIAAVYAGGPNPNANFAG
jgi:hypothetical protein